MYRVNSKKSLFESFFSSFGGWIDGRLATESMPPLLLSGCGLILSGMVLSYLTLTSIVFKDIPELIVLVPVLLGLKCCLELTLASRLTTAFHTNLLSTGPQLESFMESIYSPKSKPNRKGGRSTSMRDDVIASNMGVVLIQAITVALISVALTIGISFITVENRGMSRHHFVIIYSSTVLTSFLAALLLGLFTVHIILESSRRNVDPDNVAGPLVTGMGDLLAVLLIGGTSWLCYHFPVFCTVLAVCVTCSIPYLYRMACRHRPTAAVLSNGWQPILINLLLSLTAGTFLEAEVDSLSGGLAMLIPVINGTGGNISGIYASRYSTSLHKGRRDGHNITSSTLTVVNLPTHAIFLIVVYLSPFSDTSRLSLFLFPLLYLGAASIQVTICLRLGRLLARRAWERDLDPDNHVVPYLTAVSDLFGTASLIMISKII